MQAGNGTEWLTAELAELIVRAAHSGHGLEFVSRAPLETVATSLGVSAHVVDRARDALERAPRRELEHEVVRLSSVPPPPSVQPASPPPAGAREVIASAETHPLGAQFLLCAPLETAAVSFGVHPDVIAAAREELARRGVLPDPAEG